jgi:hypothetical protein
MKELAVPSWTEFKNLVLSKGLLMQYADKGGHYELCAAEASIFVWSFVLAKDEGDDVVDFETNYKANCNKPVSVVGAPYGAPSYAFMGNGVYGTATKETTTNFDLKINTVDQYCNGAIFYAGNAVYGDYVKCTVVDVDNILGYGAGLEVGCWITKWYIVPNQLLTLVLPHTGQVPKNLYLRIAYTSVGTQNDVSVVCDYLLTVKLI